MGRLKWYSPLWFFLIEYTYKENFHNCTIACDANTNYKWISWGHRCVLYPVWLHSGFPNWISYNIERKRKRKGKRKTSQNRNMTKQLILNHDTYLYPTWWSTLFHFLCHQNIYSSHKIICDISKDLPKTPPIR